MGRPREADPLTKVILLRLRSGDAKAVARIARREGLAISAWIRQVLLRVIREDARREGANK